jgi:predicted MFS family arabinose efflux permease
MALTHTLQSFRRSVEPWYLAYLLIGTATGGIAPMLLPLVVDRGGGATNVGLVIACIGLGGLSAAPIGDLADRYRCHRLLFAGGTLAGAGALAAFGATTFLPLWLLLALIVGVAQSAANTVANLFVVEVRPEAEWDARIGWLQTFYNAGIVIGLMAAGALSALPLDLSLLVGSGAFALAAVYGWFTTPTPPRGAPAGTAAAANAVHRRRHLLAMPHVHAPRVEWAHLSPLRLVHYPRGETLGQLARALRTPFGLFLLMWLVANVGVNAIYTLYPLVVERIFGISTGPASFALAAATAVGLLLYSPSSLASHRIGATRVLQAALVVRLVVLLGLFGLVSMQFAGREAVVLLGFATISLMFPLMSVSSTLLTSSLSSGKEGEGMGLYTTVAACAGLIGAVLGGWAAHTVGYPATLVMAAASVFGGLLLTLPLRPPPEPPDR